MNEVVTTPAAAPMPPDERARSLFAIIDEMLSVLAIVDERDGELDDATAARLDRNAADLGLKAEVYKGLCGRLLAEAAALDAMADQYSARAARKRSHVDKIKARLFSALEAVGADKIEGPTGGARLQLGDAVVQLDEDKPVPDEFMRVKRSPDMSAIKAALNGGQALECATLIRKRHLRWL